MQLSSLLKPLLFIVFALILSCAFDPVGDNFKEIKLVEPNPISLDFFNSNDTLFLRGIVALSINYPFDQDILSYRLLIDDSLATEGNGNPPNEVFTNSAKFSNGFHILKFEVYKKTNSNSIADKLNGEAFVFSYMKPAYIDNTQISNELIKITEIVIEDSTLVIKWTPYVGNGFKSYTISEKWSNLKTIIVTNQSQNMLAIPEYAGGPIELLIILAVFDQEAFTTKSYEYEINFKIDQLYPDKNKFKISCNKNPFRSWSGLSLNFIDTYLHENYIFTGKNETELEIASPVPFPFDLTLFANIKGTNTNVGVAFLNSAIKLDQNGFAINQLYPINESSYKAMSYPRSTQLNKDIFSVNTYLSENPIASYSGNLALSPNGKELFEFSNGLVVKIDPNTFEKIGQIDISTQIGSPDNFLAIEASDQSRIFVMSLFGNWQRYYVWDWLSKTIIYDGIMPYIAYNKDIELSPDGTYLFDNSLNYSYNLTITDFYAERKGYDAPNRFISNNLDQLSYASGIIVQRKAYTPFTIIKEMPYSKSVIKIISNENDVFGIVYRENNYLKIDFYKLDTFQYLGMVNLNIQAESFYDYYQIGISQNILTFRIYDNFHIMYLPFI
jgi:hypothetical protein